MFIISYLKKKKRVMDNKRIYVDRKKKMLVRVKDINRDRRISQKDGWGMEVNKWFYLVLIY